MTCEQALLIAHAYLNRRERTEHEMREHLHRRGASSEVVEGAIRELSEQGYLDDGRFARLFVQDKRDLNQWGSERIRRALGERGIPREQIDVVLNGGEAAGPDELRRALAILHRRFPSPLLTAPERKRALGFLLRRGYEYELAVDALAEHRRAPASSG